MKFIRKNKFIFILSIIIIIIFSLSTVSIINIFFPNLGVSLYGHRLDDIKSVEISKNKQIDVKNTLLKTNNVSKASVDIRGSIINIIITVKDSVNVESAKNVAIKTLDEFSGKEKETYDIQFFITIDKQDDKSLFPLIGYKNKANATVLWSGKK